MMQKKGEKGWCKKVEYGIEKGNREWKNGIHVENMFGEVKKNLGYKGNGRRKDYEERMRLMLPWSCH